MSSFFKTLISLNRIFTNADDVFIQEITTDTVLSLKKCPHKIYLMLTLQEYHQILRNRNLKAAKKSLFSLGVI